jgi:hypothetical protein
MLVVIARVLPDRDTRRHSQLDDNVRADHVNLVADQLARLNALTEPTFGL